MDLVLRPWSEEDAPAMSEAIEESLGHLRPWMPWVVEEPVALPERRKWVREAGRRGERVFGVWVDGEIAGGVGLHNRIGPGGLEIGYWIRAGHLRRGIATAAVVALCEIAFQDPALERLEIHHDRANVASGRVAAAAGFEYVREQPDQALAPADEGIELVWRKARPR